MNKVDLFESFFKKQFGCKFVTNFESVEKLIRKEGEFEIFKDEKEAQWEKTLQIFKECNNGAFIFSETKIDFHIQDYGWYYLDIATEDFFIRIEDEKTFYWHHRATDKECTQNINKTNVKRMFQYLTKSQSETTQKAMRQC